MRKRAIALLTDVARQITTSKFIALSIFLSTIAMEEFLVS